MTPDFSLAREYQICFSPPFNQCANTIINEINQAKNTIYVQAYGFTHANIISALIEAKERGVDVQIILDRSNFTARYQYNLKHLSEAGILIFKDEVPGISHNKVMIIDHRIVITGSFNFTKNADTKNAENVVILTNTQIANSFYQNWLLRNKRGKLNLKLSK